MIAYRLKSKVLIIEITHPLADNVEIKNDQDITGDGINEVFVY